MGAPQDALLVQLQRPGEDWVDVGVLHRSNERTWFGSLPGYWELPDRPVLGQVFEDHDPAWQPGQRVALPRWFSHMLPEGRLREAVANAAGVKPEREFFLLSRIGRDDLPGAVRVLPCEPSTGHTEPPAPQEEDQADESQTPAVLKFSLAGVQLKFSVTFDRERGLTVPAKGAAGDWLAKLPDGRPGYDGVPQAELAALELARAAGIVVPEARLVDVVDIAGLPEWAVAGEGKALLVQRFDRSSGNARVHVETLAQVLDISTGHEDFKYRKANFETVARVTSGLCGLSSVGDVIDRIVLNVLVGNGDAHTKNWAYRYLDGRRPELSPAFDILPTVLYVPEDDIGLNLEGSRRFEHVRLRSFERLAEKAGWSAEAGRERAAQAIDRVLGAWSVLGDHLPRSAVDRLNEHCRRLQLKT